MVTAIFQAATVHSFNMGLHNSPTPPSLPNHTLKCPQDGTRVTFKVCIKMTSPSTINRVCRQHTVQFIVGKISHIRPNFNERLK